MQNSNILDTVTIPLELELREKIHNALQGDVVNMLWEITNANKTPIYIRGCRDGRAFKIERDFFKKYYNICKEVKESLNFKEDVDFYIVSDPDVNAYAFLRPSDNLSHIIVINHSLIDMMSDDELKFAIGHEIGHLIQRHSQLSQLIDFVYPKDIKKPISLEYKVSLWHQLSELECDRYGFLAMPKLSTCVSALFKLTTGFNLNKMEMNIDEFLNKVPNNLEELFNDDFELEGTHPVNPIRVGALQVFSKMYSSDKATSVYFEDMMDQLIGEMTNISSSPFEQNLVKFFALGGLVMLSVKDNAEDSSDDEYKVIISEMSEFILNPKEYLNQCIDKISNDDSDAIYEELQTLTNEIITNDPELKAPLLDYLIRVALADKKIDQSEVDTVMALGCDLLGFSKEEIANAFAGHIQKSFNPDILALT